MRVLYPFIFKYHRFYFINCRVEPSLIVLKIWRVWISLWRPLATLCQLSSYLYRWPVFSQAYRTVERYISVLLLYFFLYFFSCCTSFIYFINKNERAAQRPVKPRTRANVCLLDCWDCSFNCTSMCPNPSPPSLSLSPSLSVLSNRKFPPRNSSQFFPIALGNCMHETYKYVQLLGVPRNQVMIVQ